MLRFLLSLAIVFWSGVLTAQSLSLVGTWQAVFHPGPQQLRVVLEVRSSPGGSLRARIYSPDQGPEPLRVDSFTADGRSVSFSVPAVSATWSGELSSGGDALRGSITQGQSSPLDFVRASGPALWIDPRLHGTDSLVPVQEGVQVQVTDWGGSGRTLVLLAGLGNTAHIFDQFAQRLTPHYHVVGITRRGFGDSSEPSTAIPQNYSASRLGEDVAVVIASLHLGRPVLVGHSIAGEELSAVATHHPDAISALVYLDAGFPYALYDPAVGDYTLDLLTLQRQFTQLLPGAASSEPAGQTLAAISAELPGFGRDLATERVRLSVVPASAPSSSGDSPLTPSDAIVRGEEKFTRIGLPALAVFAVPHDVRSSIPDADPERLRRAEAVDRERMTQVADSFQKGVPGATVVRLAHADHYLYLSNREEVLQALEAFLALHP